MEKAIFCRLVDLLRDKNLLQDTRGVVVEEQVAIFMYAISKNASNRDLQWRFQHSGETISRHFGSVLRAIVRLTGSLIQLPTINILTKISSNSKFMPYFNVLLVASFFVHLFMFSSSIFNQNYVMQDCIGAIDGTHFPISIAPHLQDPYRNRKGTLSQNVMVACNFDNRFVHVSAGWEGSASDARVLQDALQNNFYVPEGKIYLVDAGYANTPNFIAPYHNVRCHLQEQG